MPLAAPWCLRAHAWAVMCRSVGQKRTFPFFSFTRPLGEPKVPVGPLYPAQEQRGGCSTIRSGSKGGRKGGSLARRLWLWWCYWGKRRNISDGWAGGGSPQKPYPLPAVCLGRRLTVIDVRPALAVTEAKDGHGRKFLSCRYCRNRSRLGRFQAERNRHYGNRVAPKKYRSILFRSGPGALG